MIAPKLDQITADVILNGFKERIGHGIGAEDYTDILENLLNSLVSEDEPVEITLEEAKKLKSATLHKGKWYAGIIIDFPETDEDISLRMWEEYECYVIDCGRDGIKPEDFPDWLKERK